MHTFVNKLRYLLDKLQKAIDAANDNDTPEKQEFDDDMPFCHNIFFN